MSEKQEQPKSIAEEVQLEVAKKEDKGLVRFPVNYDYKKALWEAHFLLLQTKDKNKKPVLESCAKNSIFNALFEMITKGLSPGRKHCSFIAYGDTLVMQEQYEGKVMRAKRVGLIKCPAQIVWKGDEFEFHYGVNDGDIVIDKHDSKLENITDNLDDIQAAYCTLTFESGLQQRELMTLQQIKKSWNMSRTGITDTHRKFPDQMCKKTVISRAVKPFIESSDDQELFANPDNRAMELQGKAPEVDLNKELPPEQVDQETGEVADPEQTEQTEQKQLINEDPF